MNADVVPADVFKLAMRRLAAGVTIITTCHDGERCGLTATAVCSLSADPPQLLVCVNRSTRAHDVIRRGANLCVNLLARRHKALAGHFAGGRKGEERFRSGKWTTLKTSAPVLDDALASFDCVVKETVESATHTIFIGQVVDVRLRAEGRDHGDLLSMFLDARDEDRSGMTDAQLRDELVTLFQIGRAHV